MNIAVTAARSETTLKVERLIAAPPDRVFAYWTEPKLMAKWLAPGDMTVLDNAIDLRVGGPWQVVMRHPDHRTTTVNGTYLAIEPPRRLVFTWCSNDLGCDPVVDTEVEILLTEVPGGTRLVLIHTKFDTVEQRDRHAMGWGMGLDKLERMAQ